MIPPLPTYFPRALRIIKHWSLVGFLFACLGSTGWGQCFQKTTVPIGTSPRAVTVGDFNSDGRPDLVTANPDANNLSVLLNTGNGAFGVPTNYIVRGGSTAVATGDFNGDGKLDLAATSDGISLVTVRLGNGQGQFGSGLDYRPGGSNLYALAVGDFNGDGKADLATANDGSDNVSRFLGSVDGLAERPRQYGVGNNPRSIATGDFNADGKPDLVTANYRFNDISILLGIGDGNFESEINRPLGSRQRRPQAVAVGDFNGDGKTDLAVANNSTGNVSVVLGNGNGSFGQVTDFTVGSNPQSVAVVDVNGDGKSDLVTANFGSDNVSVLIGDGSGAFSEGTNIGVGSRPTSVAVGDFNGDSKPDLAVSNAGSNDISILYNCTSPAPVNTAPTVANTIQPQSATVGQGFTLSLATTFTDAQTPNTLVLSASDLPAGLSVVGTPGTSATISGTPSASGVSAVTVTATDPDNLSVSTSFTLTVNPASTSPEPDPANFAIVGVTTVSCATLSAGQYLLSFTPQYVGNNGQPISFSVINELPATTASGPYSLKLYADNPIVNLSAQQAGSPGNVTFGYNWLAACRANDPPNPANFAIIGVTTATCQVVTPGERLVLFTPEYGGANGQPITFSAVNELAATTVPGPYTLRLYTDNPTITLKAQQAGSADEALFSYNWLAACGSSGARLAATTEPTKRLIVTVLGNPIRNGQVLLQVRGADQQLLQLTLTDASGRLVDRHTVDCAAAVEQHRFTVNPLAGSVLLLRASTPTRSQTIRLVQQD